MAMFNSIRRVWEVLWLDLLDEASVSQFAQRVLREELSPHVGLNTNMKIVQIGDNISRRIVQILNWQNDIRQNPQGINIAEINALIGIASNSIYSHFVDIHIIETALRLDEPPAPIGAPPILFEINWAPRATEALTVLADCLRNKVTKRLGVAAIPNQVPPPP